MISHPLDRNNVKKLSQLIETASEVIITCHVKPDGDAVGSSLALCHVLRQLDKNALIITPDTPPRYLRFLPGFKDIFVFTSNKELSQEFLNRADIVFCLDFNSLSRVDQMTEMLASCTAPKVMIDHHIAPEQFCDITISSHEESSTCVLLYKVLCDLGLKPMIDKETAECIATGMMTDTGNLSYNCNDPDIYTVMAELLRCGIDKVKLWENINIKNENQLRLNGFAISQQMKLLCEGKAALITLTREQLDSFNYQKGDTEGLVNIPLQMENVIISVFLHEEPRFIKVSMRSKGDIDVNLICEKNFNGGGHKNAAGGEFHGPMQEAVKKVEKSLEEYLGIVQANV